MTRTARTAAATNTATNTAANTAPNAPRTAAPPADAASAPRVRVQCISKLRPWVNGKALDFKEVAEVAPEDAQTLEDREFVVVLG
ncbi:MAG TPA: hypothetical protein VEY95_11940 [Azospirillaceae bacterium]|nr:hypothetical protein [Azospirillaceae bacterium]